jgi:hypothetical protein
VLALVPLAGVLLVAGAVDLNATVIAETRAGQAPLRADGGQTAGVVGVLTPGGELAIRRSDLDLRLAYNPRIFWRQPNLLSQLRPLVLHEVSLTLTTRVTSTTALTAAASMSAGEVDYTSLPLVFGMVQAALPPVASILVVTARAGLDVQVSRLTRVGLALEAIHRRSLDDVGAMAASNVFLIAQTGVQAAPYAMTRISRLDTLSFATAVAYRWFDNGVDFLSVTPQIGWRRLLSATNELRLGAGVTYAHGHYGPLGTGPLAGDTVAPVGSAEVTGLLVRHRGIALQGAAGAMVDYYVDPILTQAQKRLTFTAGLMLSLGARWTVAVQAALGSTLAPLAAFDLGTGTVTGDRPDATSAAVSVPVRYRWADNAILEFGGRWSDRAPHTETAIFGFHQRQLWAYAMLTVTTRDLPRWGLPDGGDIERRNRVRQPPSDTEVATSSAVTSRVTSRTTDRVTGTTATGSGAEGATTTAPVPGQQGANGPAPLDAREEESETERQRELPDQSQLPIGIGGVR